MRVVRWVVRVSVSRFLIPMEIMLRLFSPSRMEMAAKRYLEDGSAAAKKPTAVPAAIPSPLAYGKISPVVLIAATALKKLTKNAMAPNIAPKTVKSVQEEEAPTAIRISRPGVDTILITKVSVT